MSGFDPKITLKKFLYGLGYTLGITALAYTIDFLEVTEFPPEYSLYTGILLSILLAIQNYIKHRND
ncbi:MAG: hypothetical protein ACTSU6_01195 [Candidatus Njordarchaeales archaeon]